MRLKIRCDGESLKILGFWVEVNKALMDCYGYVLNEFIYYIAISKGMN